MTGLDETFDLDAPLRVLGHEGFRPGQREAVQTLLEKRRLLLVAPTGGGKSLVYQLPSLVLSGTTIVVSPLIALMQDQVSALDRRGVPATFLAATLDGEELERRLAAAANGKYRLLYVAPERVQSYAFRRVLSKLQCPLIAVDEAHCISEWGHDFRPEYMELARLVAAVPGARVLACTATATPVVRDEIIGRLGLPPDTPQIVQGFARPNLILRARNVSGSRDRALQVDALLAEALGKVRRKGTGIVYAPTRRLAEVESTRLSSAGYRAAAYHAGLSAAERDSAQGRFSAGALDLVVATNAFGMGIDRADVRAVVHLSPPGSVEAYYQEVGRAGRDGEPALGLLLYSNNDLPLRRRLIESGSDGESPSPEVVEHKWNLFLELMRWTEGGSCRHDAILRYFGTADDLEGCGRCDVCLEIAPQPEGDAAEVATVVRKALSGVARVHGRFGLTAAVRLLKGTRDTRLEGAGLSEVKTFGALADRSEGFISELLRRCVTAGWIGFTSGERPVVLLSEAGQSVMAGRIPARLTLPSDAAPARTTGGRRRPAETARATPGLAAGGPLFEALRSHRLEVARAQGVPPYVVASDRTLRDLVQVMPHDESELLSVHGIGAAKAERYGRGFLDVIAAHRGG